MACGCHSAHDAAEGESDDAHRPLHETDGLRVQPQAAGFDGVDEEEVGHLGQLCLRQAVEEHEEDGCPGTFFAEKRDEGLSKAAQEVGKVSARGCSPVG